MPQTNSILAGLNDEEILDEFVKRFECDGAILIYLESNTEFGFARWTSNYGKKWVDELFTTAKSHPSIANKFQELNNQANIVFV